MARSSQEGGGDAGVDGDVQPGGLREVTGGERVHGVADVVGQDLLAEQGALGVVGAEVFFLDAVDGGAGGAPAGGEDPGPADHPVRVDPVDPDPVLTEFRGEQPDLVGLVGLGGGVGDV